MQDKEKNKAEELSRKREELKKSLLGGKFVSQKNDNPVEENPEHDSHPQSISDEPMDELLRKRREELRKRGIFDHKIPITSVDRDNNIIDSDSGLIIPQGKIAGFYRYQNHSGLNTERNFLVNESVRRLYNDDSLLNLFHNIRLSQQQVDEDFSNINQENEQEDEEVIFNEELFLEKKRKELKRALTIGDKIPLGGGNKYPIYAINRHRVLRDGSGITTLIGFWGCDLNCKYCINPMSCSQVSNEYIYILVVNYLTRLDAMNFIFLRQVGV